MTEEQRLKNAERSKKWREKNPDYMKEYMKGYRQVHLEEMRENDWRYHDEHREKKNASRREWARLHPERDRAATSAWRLKNKDRVKEWYLLRNYGITLARYNEMLVAQGGGCAICGCKEPRQRGRNYFHVDHDHETGEVRGLLCHSCNTALGHFQDSPELLQKAIAYLLLNAKPAQVPVLVSSSA